MSNTLKWVVREIETSCNESADHSSKEEVCEASANSSKSALKVHSEDYQNIAKDKGVCSIPPPKFVVLPLKHSLEDIAEPTHPSFMKLRTSDVSKSLAHSSELDSQVDSGNNSEEAGAEDNCSTPSSEWFGDAE